MWRCTLEELRNEQRQFHTNLTRLGMKRFICEYIVYKYSICCTDTFILLSSKFSLQGREGYAFSQTVKKYHKQPYFLSFQRMSQFYRSYQSSCLVRNVEEVTGKFQNLKSWLLCLFYEQGWRWWLKIKSDVKIHQRNWWFLGSSYYWSSNFERRDGCLVQLR